MIESEHIEAMDVVGDCTLLRGDAMKIIPALVGAGIRARMICCDPPYLLTSGGGTPQYEGARRMGGCFNNARYDNGGHLVACDIDWQDFMPLFYELMDEGHAYVMANNRNVQPMLNAARWPTGKAPKGMMDILMRLAGSLSQIERKGLLRALMDALDSQKEGFEFHNLLVWDKGAATPNRWYMKNCEFTGMFYKGKARPINDCSSFSCVRISQKDESNHPTEKPVALMEHYISNSSDVGDLVIDPFMGSGTTGVAAMRQGRKFIGIELDKAFYEGAVERLRREAGKVTMPLF